VIWFGGNSNKNKMKTNKFYKKLCDLSSLNGLFSKDYEEECIKLIEMVKRKWEYKAILNFIEYIDQWYGIDPKLKEAMISEVKDQFKRKAVEKF
jgi:hypothetical protein